MTTEPASAQFAKFADQCGVNLLPWQRALIDRLFDVDEETGDITARQVTLLPPRRYHH
jgi:hypothetical protein